MEKGEKGYFYFFIIYFRIKLKKLSSLHMGQILGGIIRPRLSTLSVIVVIVFKVMILFEAEELLLSNPNVVSKNLKLELEDLNIVNNDHL